MLKKLLDLPLGESFAAASAIEVTLTENEHELDMHRHPAGQLALALRGSVFCVCPDSLWLVPAGSAVWVPAGALHCIRASAGSSLCLLFVEKAVDGMPQGCCSLSLTSMVREMIRHVASLPKHEERDAHAHRLVRVLLEELAAMPSGVLRLPISPHPDIQAMAHGIINEGGGHRSLEQWAERLGKSVRTLARLTVRETGLSFGAWRRQLFIVISVHRLSAGASVKELALDLGYDSLTAFILMFRKAMGMPPAKYVAALHTQPDAAP